MSKRKENIEKILGSFHSIKNRIMLEGQKSLKQIDITPAQGQILMVVKHHGSISQKEIADHMGISASAVTQLIESLVENDYLLRKNNPADKRVWEVELSPRSLNKFHSLRRHGISKLSVIFDALTDSEVEELSKMFNKISLKIIADRKE